MILQKIEITNPHNIINNKSSQIIGCSYYLLYILINIGTSGRFLSQTLFDF
ncbi:hypothetical protein M2444_006171 [Paenibacillus sp. PastF-3]|nr:hypothetical protein [Paenibacillus sp. PastF-3]